MNYIVLDLEWNQSNTGLEEEVTKIPFEIIEIGAIKINDKNVIVSEFNELVKPKVYREMNHITSKLIHMQMEELERGTPFPDVMKRFLEWGGEEPYVFCTWGTQDLVELQRNMTFHEMEPLSNGPIAYLDVQKLFAIAYEDSKTRRTLEYGIDALGITKDIPFHRAFSDAYYTAQILSEIMYKRPEVLVNVSYDVYNPPRNRRSEIKVQFENYVKYISRVFEDKVTAFADREVSSSKCFLCRKNLRKKIRWFTANGRYYTCVAYCEKHGYLKGKIRIHKVEDGIFIVKTNRFIDEAELEEISAKQLRAKEIRKKHKQNPKNV